MTTMRQLVPPSPASASRRAPRTRALRAVRAAADGVEAAPKRVLLVGGTGRVGRSTAAALAACGTPVALTLAGRDAARWAQLAGEPWARGASFVQCDVEDPASLAAALRSGGGADLVINAAGPFQCQPRCTVLEAAIDARCAYMDVCDDTTYAQRAKSYSAAAAAAGVRAVVCAGLYPGVSNVLVRQIMQAEAERAPDAGPPKRVVYYYFTAGSGGAGTTILATSFLLCGEEVVAYKDGAQVRVPPVSGRRVVDFGRVRVA
jgi:saccharopine dehydrogenase-like NADP-dependent oxidoreductase